MGAVGSGSTARPRRALVVSLRVAPGLPKEFVTIGRHLEGQGWEVRYLLADGYRAWLPDGVDPVQVSYVDVPPNRAGAFARLWRHIPDVVDAEVASGSFDYVCVYNPHPLNARLMKRVRQRLPRSRRSVVLHEPHVPFRERPKYGARGVLKLFAVDLFSETLLWQCTDVILPSPHAQELYGMRLRRSSRVTQHLVPLCIPDASPSGTSVEPADPPYVCFVGTVNPARRVDDVVEIAKALLDAGSPVRVKILTKSSVEQPVPNVDLNSKSSISDAEIAELVSGALALLLPHTAAAQSGNVPVAFQFGTPIISYDIPGISQHVVHAETGYHVRREHLRGDALAAVDHLLSHDLRPACRALYEAQFAPATLADRYAWLTELDGSAPGS